ncbi:AlbA family DNA-binding domain-containing protein [Marisediminicola senii]|uniref:AlbA family DNA-binding domain-containing protein n=1 Tax=Marisediminicola senii TaxID=2711233 RepID=UPI0013EBE077|nr:ATP-binding protein [Marisediminicola senii]
MQFTSLHRLLGRGPSPITDELVDAAVEQQLAETDDLDWKSELPPFKALATTDFPKDVAAMANSGGGVIVYGVEEQDKVAVGRKNVGDLTEHHERTLRAAAYSAITPPVFIGLYAVGTAGNRAVVLVVPPSVDGPHLIFRDKFFGAPLRNDADTEWMKERQIEAAYRARLDERRRSGAALARLYDETTGWIDSSRAVLVAVACPRIPGVKSGRVDKTAARAILRNARNLAGEFSSDNGVHPLDNVANNPRPGLRRWVALNAATTDKSAWRAAWISIHTDGAVSMAATVGGHRGVSGGMVRDSQVDSAAIELAVADFLALIRTWSRELGPAEYDVRVGIEWAPPKPLLIVTVDQSGHLYDGTSVPLKNYVPVDASLDAASSDDVYRRRLYEIVEDCINQGGISTIRTIELPEEDEQTPPDHL